MYKILGISSVLLLILSISIGFMGFPMILKHMIKKSINLKPGSQTRQLWEKSPIAINFAVFVFNLSNPEETQNGAKPILKEVGPFLFEEWKDKFDIQDSEADDSVEFKMRNTFMFRDGQDFSGEEILTMPHPLMQSIAISIKRQNPEMLGFIAEGLKVLFGSTSTFIKGTFMELFFKGFSVDCSNEHPAAKAICSNFQAGLIQGATKINETHFRFSLMGASNHSNAGLFRVSRGQRISAELGKVLEFNRASELEIWPAKSCNRLQGTDSTIFPTYLSPAQGLWTYAPDLCRSLPAQFTKKTRYSGLPVYRYELDFGDVKKNPNTHCFCQDYPLKCPAKGTLDISACTKSPMIASLPHFLYADDKLLTAVEGLHPNESKHNTRIDMELITGTPLSFAKRLQFSLNIVPIAELPVMQNLRPLVMPLFWVEESLDLNEAFTNALKTNVFNKIKMNNIFKWICTILGLVGGVLSLTLYFIKSRYENRVTTVKPVAGQENEE